MNGKETQALRTFARLNSTKVDLIMKTLKLAGFDDRIIDFISDGLWAKRQAIIGLKLDYLTLKKDHTVPLLDYENVEPTR